MPDRETVDLFFGVPYQGDEPERNRPGDYCSRCGCPWWDEPERCANCGKRKREEAA